RAALAVRAAREASEVAPACRAGPVILIEPNSRSRPAGGTYRTIMPKLFPAESETIQGVSRAIRAKERTCLSVVEECVKRIDEWESKVHAWVRIDRTGALARARELDAEL